MVSGARCELRMGMVSGDGVRRGTRYEVRG